MSRLNQEGVDLYATNKSGKTHWIGNHMQWNWGDTLSFTFRDLETKEGTYELYLPPYSTVTSLKIGSDKGATFSFLPVTNEKPGCYLWLFYRSRRISFSSRTYMDQYT